MTTFNFGFNITITLQTKHLKGLPLASVVKKLPTTQLLYRRTQHVGVGRGADASVAPRHPTLLSSSLPTAPATGL